MRRRSICRRAVPTLFALVIVCTVTLSLFAARSNANRTARKYPRLHITYRTTDAHGVKYYAVTSQANGGTHVLRVLTPTKPARGVAHNVLYVLPVEPELGTTYGDGLETLRALNAQNRYNLTIVEPSFGHDPWYADNPKNPHVRYETFLTKDLVPWVTRHFGRTRKEENWLVGFSKSGIGAMDLILRHPQLFTLAAGWDFPADMSTYNQFGSSSAVNYGTNANFLANYCLNAAFLEAHKAPFAREKRLWIGSYEVFGKDMRDFDALLTFEGIQHVTERPRRMPHRWDGGWVQTALAALHRESAALPASS